MTTRFAERRTLRDILGLAGDWVFGDGVTDTNSAKAMLLTDENGDIETLGHINAGKDSIFFWNDSSTQWDRCEVADTSAEIVGSTGSGLTTFDDLALKNSFINTNGNDTTVTVNNSSAWTTIYSASIPKGGLKDNESYRFVVCGDYNNSTSGSARLLQRVTFGSTTMFQSGNSPALPNDSTQHAWVLTGELFAQGGASSQRVTGIWGMAFENVAPTTGYGGAEASPFYSTFGGTAAENSAGGALTLTIEQKHNTADANLTYNKYWGALLYA